MKVFLATNFLEIKMEFRINNHYHVRIKQTAPTEFSIDELEKILSAEEGLAIRFVLKESELISIACEDFKVRRLKRELSDCCEFHPLTVTY